MPLLRGKQLAVIFRQSAGAGAASSVNDFTAGRFGYRRLRTGNHAERGLRCTASELPSGAAVAGEERTVQNPLVGIIIADDGDLFGYADACRCKSPQHTVCHIAARADHGLRHRQLAADIPFCQRDAGIEPEIAVMNPLRLCGNPVSAERPEIALPAAL